MERRESTQYPIRYDAFENQGIIIENSKRNETLEIRGEDVDFSEIYNRPKAYEYAVYSKNKGTLCYTFASITSYQNKYLVLEIEKGGIIKFAKKFTYYEYEEAIQIMIEQLNKL